MKNYLLFGDSNTWGYIPATDAERFPYEQRIGGILQKLFGSEARIIEEALNGRMTHRDDPINTDKNAIRQLPSILDSHRPLDLVSIMLGVNDMKRYMNLDAFDSAIGVSALVDIIKESGCGPEGGIPEIIIIAPPPYIEAEKPFPHLFDGAAEKTKRFAEAYQEVATLQKTRFIDAASAAIPPRFGDGVHIDAAGCAAIANVLADYIKKHHLI